MLPANPSESDGEGLFTRGLRVAQATPRRTVSRVPADGWINAAVFSRDTGRPPEVAFDPKSQTSLWTIGSWFDRSEHHFGNEAKLLTKYLAVGAGALAQDLEGFFVVLIADGRKRELVAITDLIGSCHCFVRRLKGTVAISGSSLLLSALAPYELDPIGCQEFVNLGIVYEDRTVYKDIHKLKPARIYRFSSGKAPREEQYWSFAKLSPESLDGNAAVDAVWHSLVEIGKRIGTAYANPVCDLTGGYDSRAVTAGLLGAGLRFATTVSGAPGTADVRVAGELAKIILAEHVHVDTQETVSLEDLDRAIAYCDGEYNVLEYSNTLRVHDQLSAKFGISLNGSFGEVARGYWWELLWPRVGKCKRLDASAVARSRLMRPFDNELFHPQLRIDLAQHLTEAIDRTNEGLSDLPNTTQLDHVYLMMRMQRWQGRIASSTNRLWPCLSPFMCRSVLEPILNAKAHVRQRSLLIRKMLAQFQPMLARHPLEHGYPPMPVEWKTLYRFWPLATYYGEKVKQRLRQKLAKSGFRAESAPARPCLWNQERIRNVLDPPAMRTSALLAESGLVKFLSSSRRQEFPWAQQWERLLSLELAVRASSSQIVY